MLPNKLKKGDTIGIIAPSSVIRKEDLEAINRSVALIEASGYQLKFGKYAFSNTTGYGATAKEKAEDINRMFADEQVKMIWSARGGANANSCLDYLDYDLIKKNAKIVCGYSDTVSLLNAIYLKTGLVVFMGETFKGLTTWQTSYSYEEIIKCLQEGSKQLGRPEDSYTSIRTGQAEGVLVGGNLSLTTRFVAGKYALDFTDKILVMEELGWESDPEMVSNYLYHMKQNGVFEKIIGIWLGNYEHESKITIEKIVLDTIGEKYQFPIIKSNNFGHTDRKTVIPIGAKARITEDRIELIEEIVRG